MKSLLLSVSLLSVLFLTACSLEEPVTPVQEKGSVKNMIQKIQADQIGLIDKIVINNIELERTTTGAKQKFGSYPYTYSPPLELFELSYEEGETTDTYTLGIKQGGEILDLQLKYFEKYNPDFVDDLEVWMEINGVRYNVGYEILEETGDLVKAIMTITPTKPTPGTSNDYTNLVNAFNLGNGPNLNLANLRVNSLENIKLYVTF